MIKDSRELVPGDIVSSGLETAAIVALIPDSNGVLIVLDGGARHFLRAGAQLYVFGNLDDMTRQAALAEQQRREAERRQAAERRQLEAAAWEKYKEENVWTSFL
jgi:hypothetical protein